MSKTAKTPMRLPANRLSVVERPEVTAWTTAPLSESIDELRQNTLLADAVSGLTGAPEPEVGPTPAEPSTEVAKTRMPWDDISPRETSHCNVALPRALHMQLKHLAALKNLKLRDLMVEVLQKAVADELKL